MIVWQLSPPCPFPPLHKARRCSVDKPHEFHVHEQSIMAQQAPHFCRKCQSSHNDFKLHECRHRLFYVVIESFVYTVESFLGRWKCLVCRATFTAYPEYALPYKRYVKGFCASLGEYYLKKDAATYQNVTSTIGYTTQTQIIDERKLAGSTVWRWLGFFGSLKSTLRNTLEIIRQAAPNSTVFRQMSPIHHKKYRSSERKTVLEQAFQLFTADAEYQDIWGYSIFPDLATRSFWS